MPTPSKQKTVQARIFAYAEDIGWTFVPREESEQRRGLKERGLSSPRHRQKEGQECPPSLFFDDQLDTKTLEFNPRYTKAEDALLGQFRHLHTNIHGKPDYAEQTDLILVHAEQLLVCL